MDGWLLSVLVLADFKVVMVAWWKYLVAQEVFRVLTVEWSLYGLDIRVFKVQMGVWLVLLQVNVEFLTLKVECVTNNYCLFQCA